MTIPPTYTALCACADSGSAGGEMRRVQNGNIIVYTPPAVDLYLHLANEHETSGACTRSEWQEKVTVVGDVLI